MRKKRIVKAGYCYHLMSRVAHRAFFLDDEEKDRFVDLMLRVEFFSDIRIIGYAIMSNHIHIYIYLNEEREISEEELLAKIKRLYRGTRREEILQQWSTLKEEDDRLKAQEGGKLCASDFDRFKQTFIQRMFNPSEFMKTLKQHYTSSFNSRRSHTGTMWEARFASKESKPTSKDMTSILAYIDCNPCEAKICEWPSQYKWCSFAAALNGEMHAKKMYEFVYEDISDDWNEIVEMHSQAITRRIGEIEDERKAAKLSQSRSRANQNKTTAYSPNGEVEMPIPFPYQIEGGDVRTAQAIIDLLKDGPYSASEICAALGMKSRRHLNGVYIPFLLANRLIKQTLPDKPSSPKQKYSLFEA